MQFLRMGKDNEWNGQDEVAGKSFFFSYQPKLMSHFVSLLSLFLQILHGKKDVWGKFNDSLVLLNIMLG